MRVIEINNTGVDVFWSEISENALKCMKTQDKHDAHHPGLYSLDELKEHIRSGNGLCIAVMDESELIASLVVEILITDAGRSLNLTSMGGDRIHEWSMLLLDYLKGFARRYNCQDIRIYMVRKGWERALKPYGFKSIGVREYAGVQYPCISYSVSKE